MTVVNQLIGIVSISLTIEIIGLGLKISQVSINHNTEKRYQEVVY